MIDLRCISEKFQGEVALPAAARAHANADLCGIIFLNGFAGRCMEWALLTLEHFQAQMAKDKNYILCPIHKTAHKYGDMAKWIAPGTISALKCYAALPRPIDVLTLFVPANRETQYFNVPGALHRFAAKYLPEENTKPTVNLLRKWYHTVLMKMTSNQDVALISVSVHRCCGPEHV